MKRINKVLLLFLFLVSLSFGLTWEILQSNWVAQKVSQLATIYVEKKFNAQVEFSNLQFSLFPPGAEIKNFSLAGKQGDINFDIKSAEVGFYFNPVNIFETNFKVNKITLSDSFVYIKTAQANKSEDSKNDNSVNLDILDKLGNIPVNSIEVSDLAFMFNDKEVMLKKLMAENQKDRLGVDGELRLIKFTEYQKYLSKIDSIQISSLISRDVIEVKSLEVKSGFSTAELKGKIHNYVSKNIRYQLKGEGKLPLASIHKWFDFEYIGRLNAGKVSSEFNISGKGSNFDLAANIEVNGFNTDFISGENLNAKVNVNNEKIRFSNLRYKDGLAKIELLKDFEFYNLKSKKFVEEPVLAKLDKVKLDKLLTYLGPSLQMIKGEINGLLQFNLYKNGFDISNSSEISINDFMLRPSEDLEVFEVEKFQLKNAKVVYLNGDVRLEFNSHQNDTYLNILGKITKDLLEIKIPETYVDYDLFSHIMGYKIKGKGLLGINLDDKNKYLNVSVQTDVKKFEIEGYQLDKLQSNINLNLNEGELSIDKLIATSGKTLVKSSGRLNYLKSDIQAGYEIKNLDLTQVKESLAPLFNDNPLKGNEVIGLFKTKGIISGKPTLNGVKVSGEMSANTVFVYDESLENVSSTYTFENQTLFMPDFKAARSKGEITSDFIYSLKTKNYELNTLLKNVGIQDFNYYSKIPLALRSTLNGKVKVGEVNNSFYINTTMSLSQSSVYSKSYPDSFIKLDWDENKLEGDIDLFHKTAWSKFKISSSGKEKSNIKLGFDIDNLKDFLGIFTTTNVFNIDLTGQLKYRIDMSFDGSNMKVYDLNSNLENLVLKKGIIDVNYNNKSSEVIVENGDVKYWKMNARGRGFYLLSSGDGNLLDVYNSETFVKIDATILEIFNDIIQSSNGNIRGKLIYGQSKNQQIYNAFLTSNNLALTSKLLPTSISNTDMFISFKDNKINIERFNSELATGTMRLNGNVDFQNVIPNLNINYTFKDAGLVVLNKSSLVFSANGKIIGKQFPYAITGNVDIEKFNIVNEPTELGLGGGGGFQQKEIDFLPGSRMSAKDQLVNFNINITTNEPVYIRNSIADVGLVGGVQLLGGEKDPRINGLIQLAPRNNKVTFKNNDFVFSKGEINFIESESFKNPIIDFNANAQISDYKINVSVVGPVKSFNLNLVSEPSLEQTDILSLIAFGYTEDLSNNLSDSEKESMTRAGVGSILFDSFKINETLKNEFGVQVNLGTEISQDETSYLAGRSSEGNSNVGRVRSATTFEVKKKLDDNVSMAVRSTVGTSSTQKQAINLNYDINSKLSVEGVYESKSIDDQESINNDTSFGADLKWKWSFK